MDPADPACGVVRVSRPRIDVVDVDLQVLEQLRERCQALSEAWGEPVSQAT